MASIFKRWVVRDPSGRVLTARFETLIDHGNGDLEVVEERIVQACPSCRSPIFEADQIAGICDVCNGGRQLCIACAARCAGCQKQIGACCKLGFQHEKGLVVCCPDCFDLLEDNQRVHEQITRQAQSFQERITLADRAAKFIELRMQAAKLSLTQQCSLFGLLGTLSNGIRRLTNDSNRR